MTENEFRIRQWLNHAFYADKKAEALRMLVEQHRERATGLVRASECNDTGKSSTSKNGTESALMQLADIEARYAVCREEADKALSQIWEAVKSLHNNDLEAVIINRYLNSMTIEQTAEFMGYSIATVKRKTKEAIQKMSQNELE
jgi:Sigma-70, region 4.